MGDGAVGIGGLTNIRKLWLGGINIAPQTIPSSLYSLTHLQELDLSESQLIGSISDRIGDLVGLTELYLGGNRLDSTCPTSVGKLSQLQHLWLNNNALSGSVPDTVGQLTRLHTM